jgi:hypothetical protein
MAEENKKDFNQFVDSLDDSASANESVAKDSGERDTLTEDKLSGTDVTEGDTTGAEEGESESEEGEGGGGEPAEPKKKGQDAKSKPTYTAEELNALLESGGTVDSDRLSPEGKLLMKSFQRGYDEKFKALAEERKRLAEKHEAELSPKEKLFRRYLSDPTQVVNEINAEIERLDDPNAEDYARNRKLIAQLVAMKDEFRENRTVIVEAQKSKDSAYARMMAAVLEDIPDWKEKEPALTRFAQAELGLTLEDIRVLSDPTIMGDRTLRFIKAVNRAYDKMNAGKLAEKKVNKSAPKKLGRAGEASDSGGKTAKEISEMSYAEYKAYRENQFKKKHGVK